MKAKKMGKSVQQYSWMSILVGIIALSIVLSIAQPAFFSATNFKNIIVQSSFTAVIAIGMAFVIMSGGIDISVGMSVFLSMSIMISISGVIPIPAVMLIGVAVTTAVGVFNGFLVCILKIVPMIATLATFTLCRGIAFQIVNFKVLSAPEQLRVVGLGSAGALPIPILILIISIIIGTILLKYTRFGRFVLAVGNSKSSAMESGLPYKKIQYLTYVICGFCVGIAALIYVGRLGNVQTDTAYGTEFAVITAVVLGGTKLSGGKGSIIGVVLGCIFMMLIENGLSMMEVTPFYYDVVRGGVLFVAILIDTITTSNAEKKLLAIKESRIRETF